jgi:hypothetical protein
VRIKIQRTNLGWTRPSFSTQNRKRRVGDLESGNIVTRVQAGPDGTLEVVFTYRWCFGGCRAEANPFSYMVARMSWFTETRAQSKGIRKCTADALAVCASRLQALPRPKFDRILTVRDLPQLRDTLHVDDV